MEAKKGNASNVFSSLSFMFKSAWNGHRIIFVEGIFIIASFIGLTLAELIIGPRVLSIIENRQGVMTLITNVLVIGGMITVFAAVDGSLLWSAKLSRMVLRLDFIRITLLKTVTVSYSTLDTKTFSDAFENSTEAIMSNESAGESIWGTLFDLIKGIIMLCIVIFILRRLPIYVILISVVATVVSFILSAKVNLWEKSKREVKSKARNGMTTIAEQTYHSNYGKDIRYFGMQAYLLELWRKSYNIYFDIVNRADFMRLGVDFLELAFSVLRNGVMFYILVGQAIEGKLSAAQFLLYFSSVNMFTSQMLEVLKTANKLFEESVVLQMLVDFLNQEEKFLFEKGKPLKRENIDYTLELKNVSFKYDGQKEYIIKNMSLVLKPGEKLAVVGLNGAGKTTLIKLLLGLYDPSEGAVLLNGQDIRQYNRWDYYLFFSAVFQECSFIPGTIRDNITSDNVEITDEQVENAVRLSGLDKKIKGLADGLDSKLVKAVYNEAVELSGGETQRLLLARAICKQSEFLILDEPTSALDPIAESEMYKKYDELSEGRSSVFISHRLATTRFCDRIIMIADGIIIEEGTHEQLMEKNGEYAHLFEIQSQYYREEAKL